MRVLIVDDNVDAATMLGEALDALGYETRVAHDGVAALNDDGEAPHVALLDIGLPVMDGYELARRLRERHPNVRLVAITGYGQASDQTRSREAGFEDHLTKPVAFERVTAVLDSMTARHFAHEADR